jgi:hypothetical protein
MSKRNWVFHSVPMAGIIVLLAALAPAQAGRKPKETATTRTQFLNPDGLSKPTGYTHVVVTQPGMLVYVSGQVG